MSNPMEVDAAGKEGGGQEDSSVKISVHPLAIVNMSDQYTRITYGGSPLDKRAPVVGLLFGLLEPHASSSSGGGGVHLRITDAEDIPTDSSEAAVSQVSLHQAVFPQHSVIGWYRVSKPNNNNNNNNETSTTGAVPTADDLVLTRTLQHHYQSQQQLQQQQSSEPATTTEASPSLLSHPFIFALLEAPASEATTSSSNRARNKSSAASTTTSEEDGENEDDDDDDDLLPLMLYKLHSNHSVLEALHGWKLDTSEPERIAVERVMREQPQRGSVGDGAMVGEAGGDVDATVANDPSSSTSSFHYAHATRALDTSLQAIHSRMTFLVNFLQDVQSGKVPSNYSLLRQVQSLLLQMGPLANFTSSSTTTQQQQQQQSSSSSSVLLQLGLLAKTVDAVQSYSDKFRIVYEGSPSAGVSGRGPGGPMSGGGGSGGGLRGEARRF